MAHKTLIDGTAYEISGGKTLIDGTAYGISGGKTLIGGTVYEVGFSKLPSDIDNSLEFTSADAFSISAAHRWEGTLEYCNGVDGWQEWDGSEISSYASGRGHYIYIRGTGNNGITYGTTSAAAWTLTGTSIACNGNIETLLDYAQVKAGIHPSMEEFCFGSMFANCTNLTTAPALPATTVSGRCYRGMFANCTNLTTAPALPATTLGIYCYESMFQGCTSLATVPALPATTLKNYCYRSMFQGCTQIKLSRTRIDTYTQEYRIPFAGTGTSASSALSNMFAGTGGTFTGSPSIDTTYYLDSANTIVY